MYSNNALILKPLRFQIHQRMIVKVSVMGFKDLNPNVLKNRLNALGWTSYRLAKEVAKIRSELYGEVIENPKSLVNGINACLKDPDRSSGKTLKCVTKAMGGSLTVK
jgi:hypothetical protein